MFSIFSVKTELPVAGGKKGFKCTCVFVCTQVCLYVHKCLCELNITQQIAIQIYNFIKSSTKRGFTDSTNTEYTQQFQSLER